jgi:hypothetical protein
MHGYPWPPPRPFAYVANEHALAPVRLGREKSPPTSRIGLKATSIFRPGAVDLGRRQHLLDIPGHDPIPKSQNPGNSNHWQEYAIYQTDDGGKSWRPGPRPFVLNTALMQN